MTLVCPCFFKYYFAFFVCYLNQIVICSLSLISIYSPSFRSYKPADESLRDLALPEAQVEEITDKVKDELENEDKGVVMESLVSYIAV